MVTSRKENMTFGVDYLPAPVLLQMRHISLERFEATGDINDGVGKWYRGGRGVREFAQSVELAATLLMELAGKAESRKHLRFQALACRIHNEQIVALAKTGNHLSSTFGDVGTNFCSLVFRQTLDRVCEALVVERIQIGTLEQFDFVQQRQSDGSDTLRV